MFHLAALLGRFHLAAYHSTRHFQLGRSGKHLAPPTWQEWKALGTPNLAGEHSTWYFQLGKHRRWAWQATWQFGLERQLGRNDYKWRLETSYDAYKGLYKQTKQLGRTAKCQLDNPVLLHPVLLHRCHGTCHSEPPKCR